MANVLGALALHIADQIQHTTDVAAQHGAAAPSALVSILNHPGQTIDYLRQVLDLTHSGTVRLVDRLHADGLVVRDHGTDGRSLALTCTPTGSKRARLILTARRKVVEPLVTSLSDAEKKQLKAILYKLPWAGVSTTIEALHTCRLCEESSCDAGGDCPVTLARISTETGNRQKKPVLSTKSEKHRRK